MQSLSLRCLLFLVFATALLLASTNIANACSCGPRPTVLEAFDGSDEVVILRAISVEKAQLVEKSEDKKDEKDEEDEEYVDAVKSTTMVVEKVFKGKLKVRDEIVFGQGGGADCIWTFNEKDVGHQFLVYLIRPEKTSEPLSREDGLWLVFGCGRSTVLQAAGEDLRYLENISKLRGKTRISGTIGGGFQYPDLDVEGKKIKIIGPNKTYETKTDKDGVFEVYDVPPGKYFIEPELPPNWKIDASWLGNSQGVVDSDLTAPRTKSLKRVAIVLEPKKHTSVEIVFTVDNSVRGRVLDPKGRPMYGVGVYLLRPEEDETFRSDATDEQGRFEFNEVPDGAYVLVANQDGKLSNREPFPKIFYPSVMERERAAVINIKAGDKIANLDIVIPKLEEIVTITGVLQYSDGKPVAEKWLSFQATANEKIDGLATAKTDQAGRFTLTVLKGLTGELSSEFWLWKGVYKNCPKVDELVAKSEDESVSVYTNVVKLTTEHDVYDVELTFPFPLCKKVKE